MSTPRRLLVVIGTPLPDTLVHALAAAYVDGAGEAGAETRVIDLARQPIPAHPRFRDELRAPRDDHDRPLDAEVAPYVESLAWADHVTIAYPQWWGTYPAALKAFIDRVFLANSAFAYHRTGRGWDRFLSGRTARLIMTMDSPAGWNRLVYRNAAETSLTRATLGYCGIRTTGISRFSEVRHRSNEVRERWIRCARDAGAKDAAAKARVAA
jgi:putative NADPH-quinone reductase